MKQKNSKKPFFASFLEKQVKNPEKVNGGQEITTALEDSVTIPTKDNVTSALSDSVTKPGLDHVTMKYPSDGDDSVE
ncbi:MULTISPECIES: microviridin/marinostatin family tricyclic proteinase inhibitor [Chryseobacterium]|uniref:Serine endopeptidase n=2 Tax=Chryseobacterium TaxID=59732 RepID=A0A172XXY7_9FLAO|nr:MULTISPECIES: microviridin/marinostatin family tricyclic proteinase inhibitor [Chryseobacterium]ANF51824.1 serine endopeptidase [Chryseobacterium glaciei]AZA51634.1 serine endopeptidase [Chryseobacterium sp. G0201]SFZ94519.1 Serine endopeptidase inhibitors [Chryseobacterium limigenitum]